MHVLFCFIVLPPMGISQREKQAEAVPNELNHLSFLRHPLDQKFFIEDFLGSCMCPCERPTKNPERDGHQPHMSDVNSVSTQARQIYDEHRSKKESNPEQSACRRPPEPQFTRR